MPQVAVHVSIDVSVERVPTHGVACPRILPVKIVNMGLSPPMQSWLLAHRKRHLKIPSVQLKCFPYKVFFSSSEGDTDRRSNLNSTRRTQTTAALKIFQGPSTFQTQTHKSTKRSPLSLFDICVCVWVLLSFIKLILGNRYGPGCPHKRAKGHAPNIGNCQRTSSPCPPTENLGWPDPRPLLQLSLYLY